MNASIVRSRLKSTFPALTHRNFRLFWGGQCISLIGTWMQNIGQSWLVLQVTKSPFKLGLVSAMQFLPMMLFALFAGTFIDRFPKRKVLLFTQSCLMVLAAILATLTTFGWVQYWHVLVLALLLGLVNTIDMPTRQSFFIELVGKEDLMNAIALNSTIFNLARIVGPAIAGIMIGLLGIGACFYLNAASFIAVIAGIWAIDIPLKTSLERKKMNFSGIVKDIQEGLRYIVSRPVIFLPLVLLAVISTFVMNFNVLIPIYANQTLGQDAAGYGLLMTSMGVGSFIGALTLAAKSKRGPKMWILLTGALGMSVFMLGLGFGKIYFVACLLLLLTGVCSIAFTASVNTMIQINSEDHMRGRVMSVYSLVFGGVTPIGSLYAGKVTDHLGAPACIIISGGIGIFAAVIISFLLHKSRKS